MIWLYWMIIALVVLDILLTHYYFFLMRKKKCFDINDEVNLIPRLIMKGDPSPKTFIMGTVLNITIIGAVLSLVDNVLFGAIFGMLVIVVFSHYINVLHTYKVWDSKMYWRLLRKIKKIRRDKKYEPNSYPGVPDK